MTKTSTPSPDAATRLQEIVGRLSDDLDLLDSLLREALPRHEFEADSAPLLGQARDAVELLCGTVGDLADDKS